MRRAVQIPLKFLVPAFVGALALPACAPTVVEGPPPLNALSRYTLQVEPGVDRIALAVHEQGLSSNQTSALAALADRFSVSGAPVIRVEAPAGNDPVADQAAWAVRDALSGFGVPPERVLVMAYDAPNARAPVLAGFETVRAYVPDCSGTGSAGRAAFSNQSSPGLGCALTANMAAQIANPRDIVGPQPLGPAEGGRRSTVFDNYRAGRITSAPQEPIVDGQISEAVE